MSDSSSNASTVVNVDMMDQMGAQVGNGDVDLDSFVQDSEHVVVSPKGSSSGAFWSLNAHIPISL